MSATWEQVKASRVRQTEEVQLGDLTVKVRGVTWRERVNVYERLRDVDHEKDPIPFRRELLWLSLVNDDGSQMFSSLEDVDREVFDLPPADLESLVTVAIRLGGFSAARQKEQAKNSDGSHG